MPGLSDSVRYLKGVGPQLAERLAKLGIVTVQDILFHLPLRYEDRTRVVPLGGVRANRTVLVEVEVQHAEVVFRPRRSLLCRVSDGTGSLTLRFFHFSQQQQDNLTRGKQIRCYGLIRQRGRDLEMIHPEYQSHATEPLENTLTPIYPSTEGLQQRTLRRISDQALELLQDDDQLQEFIPDSILNLYRFPTLSESVNYVHRPPVDAATDLLLAGTHLTQQRLAFEELLAHNLSLLQLRQRVRQHHAPVITGQSRLQKQFIDALPFELTAAQQTVIAQINQDLASPIPALRLIQGDVGSGKTVVAAAAAVSVIERGYQAAVMAPTELLAEQHYHNFLRWLSPLHIKVALLTGRMRSRKREQILVDMQSGHTQLIIGTHALFQQDVCFQNLAMMVIDEQHRFGVHQRMALRDKGVNGDLHPHQFTMTATPIPRSLAMTAYADLDYSVIDELPRNRHTVKTVVLSNERRPEVIQRIERACLSGRQAYWICTLVEESEVLQCEAAEDTTQALQEMLPNVRVGLVHGRMKSQEKEAQMQAFKQAEVQLLVATTVVEVGVDVPNASLMIIENAERLGLSQLHQLRGRVGRGEVESSCVLLYQAPLSEKARTRLDVIRKHNDGFEVARQDLKLRGPGEVLGTRQAGLIDFKIADICRDEPLLQAVKQTAVQLIHEQPERVQAIVDRWLAHKQQFRNV